MPTHKPLVSPPYILFRDELRKQMGKIEDEQKFRFHANEKWVQLSKEAKLEYSLRVSRMEKEKQEETQKESKWEFKPYPGNPLVPLNTWSCDHFYIEEFTDKINIKRLTGQDIKFVGNYPCGKNVPDILEIGNGLYIFYDMKDWCLKIYDDYGRIAHVNN